MGQVTLGPPASLLSMQVPEGPFCSLHLVTLLPVLSPSVVIYHEGGGFGILFLEIPPVSLSIISSLSHHTEVSHVLTLTPKARLCVPLLGSGPHSSLPGVSPSPPLARDHLLSIQ